MQRQRAADSTIGTYCVCRRLLVLIPRPGNTHVVFRLEGQRAGRAHADTVSAINTRGLGQRYVVLGGDGRSKSATADRDRKSILRIFTASFDTFVTKDALRVVAYVKLVIDLDRL